MKIIILKSDTNEQNCVGTMKLNSERRKDKDVSLT